LNYFDKRYPNKNEVYEYMYKKDGRINYVIKLLEREGFIVQEGFRFGGMQSFSQKRKETTRIIIIKIFYGIMNFLISYGWLAHFAVTFRFGNKETHRSVLSLVAYQSKKNRHSR